MLQENSIGKYRVCDTKNGLYWDGRLLWFAWNPAFHESVKTFLRRNPRLKSSCFTEKGKLYRDIRWALVDLVRLIENPIRDFPQGGPSLPDLVNPIPDSWVIEHYTENGTEVIPLSDISNELTVIAFIVRRYIWAQEIVHYQLENMGLRNYKYLGKWQRELIPSPETLSSSLMMISTLGEPKRDYDCNGRVLLLKSDNLALQAKMKLDYLELVNLDELRANVRSAEQWYADWGETLQKWSLQSDRDIQP